jgi:hypothetical protein
MVVEFGHEGVRGEELRWECGHLLRFICFSFITFLLFLSKTENKLFSRHEYGV